MILMGNHFAASPVAQSYAARRNAGCLWRPFRKAGASVLAMTLVILSTAHLAHAAGNEERLRDELRRTITQLRQMEDENATLRTQAADAKAAQTAQAGELATLKQQLADSDGKLKEIGEAKQQLTLATAETRSTQQRLGETQALLDKWQGAYKQAANVARARDGAAKHFYAVSWRSGANLKMCLAKNEQLSKIGLEVLDKYQNEGVAEAIKRDEPFTKLARVKLENQLQDYADQIDDNKLALSTGELSGTSGEH